ncbi:MAG: hypothetical protein ACRDNE_18950, partial [Gaiellaceae bacterium]
MLLLASPSLPALRHRSPPPVTPYSVQTGLRRAELIALDWSDLELDGSRPSLLVRCGKGGKPPRQPLAPPLARE